MTDIKVRILSSGFKWNHEAILHKLSWKVTPVKLNPAWLGATSLINIWRDYPFHLPRSCERRSLLHVDHLRKWRHKSLNFQPFHTLSALLSKDTTFAPNRISKIAVFSMIYIKCPMPSPSASCAQWWRCCGVRRREMVPKASSMHKVGNYDLKNASLFPWKLLWA